VGNADTRILIPKQIKSNMQSPLILPHALEDLLPSSFNLWDGSDSVLNPCWEAPQLSPSLGHQPDSVIIEGQVPFRSSTLDPDGVQAERTILLFAMVGMVFFLVFMITIILIFMVNLLWMKHMKKVITSWGCQVLLRFQDSLLSYSMVGGHK
jgi:hypothetical protein